MLALLAPGCGSTNPSDFIPALVAPVDFSELDNGCLNQSNEMVWDFDWADVPGAVRYELYVKSSTASIPAVNTAVGPSSYRHSGNSYTTTLSGWEWKVRAYVDGEFKGWSKIGQFAVEPWDTDCK